MIHELRTYTLRPGAGPTVAKNAGEVGRAIRGDDYGKLEGYWVTEIGPLNQVMHLWSYADLDERQRLRGELAKNERWTKEYVPLIRPHLVRQDVRLLDPILPLKAPETGGNVYEFRNYRTAPGRVREWAKRFREIMPMREEYSKNTGAWITEAGQPNEVCHLWAYPSVDARTERRAAVAADPRWGEFLKGASPLLEEMHSTILLPAAHSPLK